jgi:hypothetical protein
MHIVLPHCQIALLRQRVGDRTGIGPAECLEFVGGKPDDDFVLDGNDLEQIRLVLLRPGGLRACKYENRQSAAFNLSNRENMHLSLYAW